jgi:hypothetical protein
MYIQGLSISGLAGAILHESHTDKKENIIFSIYKENQNGAVAKSYMKKGFLIYEEMRKYLTIYEKVFVIIV